jgi:hypothetical protein
MEVSSFDLLWLPEPIEACLHDDTALALHDAELRLRSGDTTAAYTVRLAYCPSCTQWYGLLQVAEALLNDAGLTATALDAFELEGEPVQTGVHFPPRTMPWAVFGRQMEALSAAQEQPTPPAAAVQQLDRSPTVWQVNQIAIARTGPSSPERQYVALVHGPSSIRGVDVQADTPFDAPRLATLVRRAAGTPQPPAQPTRPRAVRLADPSQANALHPHLAPTGIEVEVGDTPRADAALADITDLISQ